MASRAPDGQLTRVSSDTNGDNAYWYLGAQHFNDVSATLPDLGSQYILLILCDAEGLTLDELQQFVGPLVRRGCVAVCCWGPACNLVELAFDFVGGEYDVLEMLKPQDVLMTTSHADEPIAEAFWFFQMCTHPLDADRLAIVIGDHDDWKDEIWGYLADPRSSFVDEDEST